MFLEKIEVSFSMIPTAFAKGNILMECGVFITLNLLLRSRVRESVAYPTLTPGSTRQFSVHSEKSSLELKPKYLLPALFDAIAELVHKSGAFKS